MGDCLIEVSHTFVINIFITNQLGVQLMCENFFSKFQVAKLKAYFTYKCDLYSILIYAS